MTPSKGALGSGTVAALYVDPAGVYAGLPGVEVWDEARDARTYPGPWPVVAHPPCNHWCQLASVNAARYESFEVGDDCGERLVVSRQKLRFATSLGLGWHVEPCDEAGWRMYREARKGGAKKD